MPDNNTVILRVQLDEGKTEDQLKQLVLDLEATRKAQQALTAERKAGTLSDADFSKQSVELKTQLRGQSQEYNALQKNLELYRTAQNGEADSYKATQAALSLSIRQQQELAGSSNNTSEASQALSKQIAQYRETLAQADKQQGLFARNIGNYPTGTFDKLASEVAHFQQVQQGATAGTEQATQAAKAEAVAMQQLTQAAAAEGKTVAETQAKIASYTQATTSAASATGKLSTETTATVDVAGKASNAFSDAATKGLGLFSNQTDKATGLLTKFKTGGDLVKQGLTLLKPAGETGAQGFKAVGAGIALTGLGVFLLLISAVISYFTQSAEGGKLLKQALAGVGAVVNILTTTVTGFGKAIIEAVSHPVETIDKLGNAIKENLINRFTAFGVILDGIKSGDFTKIGDGIIQVGSGIENASEKVKGLAQGFADTANEAINAAKQAARVEAEGQRLVKVRRDIELEDKKEQGRVEVLLRLSKDQNLTHDERKKKLQEAGEIEEKASERSIDLSQRELVLLQQKLALANGTKDAGEIRADIAAKELEVQDKRNERENTYAKIRVRESAQDAATRAENKTAAAKALADRDKAHDAELKQRRELLALDNEIIERQLLGTEEGSEKELALLRRKLENNRLAELAVKNLTVAQTRAIDEKAANDQLKLTADFNKKRILAAYDAELASVSAELTLVKKGADEETELRREAIDTQLRKELAALDQRKNNIAEEALLRANAAKATNDLNYSAALAKLDIFLKAQRNSLDENYAKAAISEKEYNDAVIISDQLAAGSRLQLAREFKQDTVQLEQQATAAKLAGIKAVGDKERAAQTERMAQAQSLAEGLTALFAETISTTGATLEDFARKSLILVIDSIEKSVIAAQIKIIAESLASADSIASYGILGLAKSAAIIGLVVAATETLKAKLQPTSVFAEGTVLGGASHANGGVQLYSRTGHHFGEAEKDEIILTKGVWQNPLLRPLASSLNVMGGGRPLLPNFPTPHMAQGGVSQPLILDQLRGDVAAVSPAAIGKAVADSLRKNPPVNRWSDFEKAQSRNKFTNTQASA